MPEINFDEYWRLRMDAASRKLEAAREIISHPGTRGSLAEHFLRDLIRDFIPQRYGIGTGFVVRKGGPSSLQIDVLVYDQLSSSPLYKDGELVVLTAGSAKVAIEVKSQLNSDEIPRAYTNIASVKSIDPEVTGIVFGYDGVQADKFAEHVGNWAAEAQVPRSRWPDGVYHLGGAYFAIADPAPEDGRLTDEAQFKVRKGVDPVVWLFLTAVLSRLNLTNIEEYMPAGRFEEEVLASL